REDADAVTLELRRDERGDEALQGVETHRRQPQPAAVHAPDVRRPDVAAALLADVLVAEDAHEPEPPRHGARHIPGSDEEGGGDQRSVLPGRDGVLLDPAV